MSPIRRIIETAEHFGGTLNTKSGADNLRNEQVPLSENMRVNPEGGRYGRPGFTKKYGTGSGSKVDTIFTHEMHDVMFRKTGTAIEQSTDGITWYDIGVTRTASEREFFFAFGKDVFACNKTDSFLRIMVSTLDGAVADSDTEIDLRAGDGGFFDSSGAAVIYVNGDEIDYNGITTDQLQSVTNIASGGHVSGSIVTQTSTPADGPKGSCAATFERRAIVGGVSANPNALFYSAPQDEGNPQFIYDYQGNGSSSVKTESDVTALHSGDSVMLIGMKKGMAYAYGFDINLGHLMIRPLTQVEGVPNAFCMTQLGGRYYVFTGKRVLPVAVQGGQAAILDDPNTPFAAFDFPIRGILDNADEDQSMSFIHSDPTLNELTISVIVNGISNELVWDGDSAKWQSKDTGKTFACKTNFKGRVYAGDDSNHNVYIDNEGTTDDGIAINHRMLTKVWKYQGKAISGRKFTFSGKLSALGEFAFRTYLDGVLAGTENITATDLIDRGLMDTAAGEPLGGGTVGPHTLGSSGSTPEVFPFTYPYTMKLKGESLQMGFESFDEGTGISIDDAELVLETSSKSRLPSQ